VFGVATGKAVTGKGIPGCPNSNNVSYGATTCGAGELKGKDMEKIDPKKDAGKLRYDLIPWEVLEELAKVLTLGAEKYDDNNWKIMPRDQLHRYKAPLLRHLSAAFQGYLNDDESKELHLSHALCNLVFLVWFELEKRDGAIA
jgi:hypothetical protein